jgi:hypothetical protein
MEIPNGQREKTTSQSSFSEKLIPSRETYTNLSSQSKYSNQLSFPSLDQQNKLTVPTSAKIMYSLPRKERVTFSSPDNHNSNTLLRYHNSRPNTSSTLSSHGIPSVTTRQSSFKLPLTPEGIFI